MEALRRSVVEENYVDGQWNLSKDGTVTAVTVNSRSFLIFPLVQALENDEH